MVCLVFLLMYSTLKSELLTRINEAITSGDEVMAGHYTNLLCEATKMAIMEAPIIKKKEVVLYFDCPSCHTPFKSNDPYISTCTSCGQPMSWNMNFLQG